MNILVIRFRQMGDAILATPLLNTLHASFPEAHIDMVLNDRIAPLFEGHPALHRIHTFTNSERHHVPTYLRKVWNIVHSTHYDAIIDMRSTVNTQLFALFSPSTPYRIGIDKAYTRLSSNHRMPACGQRSMIDHNIGLASPLAAMGPIVADRRITLPIGAAEIADMRQYLQRMHIDFDRPLVLMGVTAKLPGKVWAEDRMTWVVDRFVERFPEAQLIFNYAPGDEEVNARRIYANLKDNRNVFIDVQTRSPRELFALAHLINLYFGNEGGARHIVHAAGKPSYVVCAPGSNKTTWIPRDSVPADGIAAADLADTATMTAAQMYATIDRDSVWKGLCGFIQHHNIAL